MSIKKFLSEWSDGPLNVINVTGLTTNLTAADCTGKKEYTQYGSVVINNFNLPAAAANLKVRLRVVAGTPTTVGIKWTCNGAETANIGIDALANCTSYVVGSIWELDCEQSGTSSYKWRARLVGRQPRVYVKKDANQTGIASNTPTKVIWGALIENNNGDFGRVAADRWDCSIPGRYRWSSCYWTNPDAAGQRKHIALYKDGNIFKGNNLVSTSTTDISVWGDWSDDVMATKNYELYASLVHAGAGGTIYQTDPNLLGYTYWVIERESD